MEEILIGGGGSDHRAPTTLRLRYANRHGLVAGATGTGKTVTLQALAEGFSSAGVPVFLSDVKGDLSGLCQPGADGARLRERAAQIGLEPYEGAAFPTVFWDLFGAQGHPIRTTVSEMGPLLLSRMLELNEVQEGVINVVFRLADDEGLLLLDLKDLQALLAEAGKRSAELSLRYGAVAPASIGAIQRRLLVLENQGAGGFFGEPALALSDLMATDAQGRGRVNVLAADRLMRSPRLYATFLLWLLSALFEELPEVGDPDRPVLAFFFDEAHLLFAGAPRPLVEKVEQVARLIRSKGVSVWFVTQSPADIPETVLGQLGNRVQHALRAYTPADARAVRSAAQSFRPNPAFDTAAVISELGVGEALVSTLGDKGAPSVVERTLVRPPSSRLGPADPPLRAAAFAASPIAGRYEAAIDRHSAYEMLQARGAAAAGEAASTREGFNAGRRYSPTATPAPRRAPARTRETPGEAFVKSMARSIGSQAGRSLMRGVLGGLFRGR
jgi:DNA helicase HerA-like ATPase